MQTGFGFTGEVTDASGLVYLRARYYAPGLGVFPSLDPLELPNRYGYVRNNPANWADPSGMADPKCKLAVKAMLAWDGISPEEEVFAEQLCTFMEVAETSQASFSLIRVLWESYGGVASSLLSAVRGWGTVASAALSPLLSLSPAVHASAALAIPALMLAMAPPLPPYTTAQLSAMRPPTPGAKPEPIPTGTPAPTTQSVPLPTAQNPTVCPTATPTSDVSARLGISLGITMWKGRHILALFSGMLSKNGDLIVPWMNWSNHGLSSLTEFELTNIDRAEFAREVRPILIKAGTNPHMAGIHVNLEALEQKHGYDNYELDEFINVMWRFDAFAYELKVIRDEDLCERTSFYINGSVAPEIVDTDICD